MNRYRDFQGRKNILCNTRTVDTCHYKFVQMHSMSATKVNLNVNDGLQVIMICQWRFINCNKHTSLVEDTDNTRG